VELCCVTDGVCPALCPFRAQVSTLDLCTADRLGVNMLLMCTAPSPSNNNTTSSSSSSSTHSAGQGWLTAGLQLQSQGWPLQVLQVLPQGSDPQAAAAAAAYASGTAGSSSHAGPPPPAQQQQPRCAVDVEGAWGRLQESCGSAAVLVRPDGHIAWRSTNGSSSSGGGGQQGASAKWAEEQQSVLEQVLRGVLYLTPEE
jgi:hypothetical protein